MFDLITLLQAWIALLFFNGGALGLVGLLIYTDPIITPATESEELGDNSTKEE